MLRLKLRSKAWEGARQPVIDSQSDMRFTDQNSFIADEAQS